MAYHVTGALGYQDIGETSTVQKHPLGTRVIGTDPTYGDAEFIYLKGVANTAVGNLVTYDAKDGVTVRTVAASKGPCAVAMSANVADQYGWYCVKAANVPITCAAAAAVDVALYVTATAGAVDDAVVAGQGIVGAVLNTAAGGAANADARINYPDVGAL